LLRLADLLQRESLITNPQERTQLEALAHSVGAALEELSLATNPVIPLFRNVQIGSSPGEFRMNDRVYRPVSSQPNPNVNSQGTRSTQDAQSTISNQNLFPSNLQNLGAILNPNQSRPQNQASQPGPSQQGLGSLNLGSMMQMMGQVNYNKSLVNSLGKHVFSISKRHDQF
jgi:hypothetical protein